MYETKSNRPEPESEPQEEGGRESGPEVVVEELEDDLDLAQLTINSGVTYTSGVIAGVLGGGFSPSQIIRS